MEQKFWPCLRVLEQTGRLQVIEGTCDEILTKESYTDQTTECWDMQPITHHTYCVGVSDSRHERSSPEVWLSSTQSYRTSGLSVQPCKYYKVVSLHFTLLPGQVEGWVGGWLWRVTKVNTEGPSVSISKVFQVG